MTFARELHTYLAGKPPFTLAELAIVFPRVGKRAIQQELDGLLKAGAVAVEESDDGLLWRWQPERPKQSSMF